MNTRWRRTRSRPGSRIGAIIGLLAILMAGPLAPATADPGTTPEPLGPFPPGQNQLPRLPSEPNVYGLLPIPVPAKDSWYNDPPNIASLKPGEIVRTREVQTRVLGIPFPVYTKQLLFRSEDVHGRPIVTATTVIVPGIAWTGSPRPVVSFQEAIDSTDSSCNPSYTLRTGTMKEASIAVGWLLQGFALNIPDFDGKYNTFNTYDEGKMVLDSLRAMKSDRALGLKNSGIAMYGYSGGGSATMRAAELRKSYAPDVKILGASLGGTPGNLVEQARYALQRQPSLPGIGNFTMWLGFASFGRQYPDVFDAKKLLTGQGQALVDDMQSRCIYTVIGTGMWRPISEYFQPGKTLEGTPSVMKVLKDNSLGHHVPDIPLFWFHSVWDEIIPPRDVVLPTVQSLWERGADLRFVTAPLPEHVVMATTGWIPATAWTSALLRGLPPGPKFFLPWSPLPKGFPGA